MKGSACRGSGGSARVGCEERVALVSGDALWLDRRFVQEQSAMFRSTISALCLYALPLVAFFTTTEDRRVRNARHSVRGCNSPRAVLLVATRTDNFAKPP
jgi:hypothetical protein